MKTTEDLTELVIQIHALQAECLDNSAGHELAGIALALVDRLAEARRSMSKPRSAEGAT